MRLANIALTGSPVRVMSDDPDAELAPGVLGVDVTRRAVDGVEHTVLQVLLDDDRPDFDPGLLDAPVVADVLDAAGGTVARELLDHDRFRAELLDERQRAAGRRERRGVLLLTDGALPEPWVRLAFLPVPLASTAGTTLQLQRTTAAALVAAVEHAVAAGAMTDQERTVALTTIDHLHHGSA